MKRIIKETYYKEEHLWGTVSCKFKYSRSTSVPGIFSNPLL